LRFTGIAVLIGKNGFFFGGFSNQFFRRIGRFFDGKLQDKGASLAGFALDPDAAVMHFDKFFGQSQPYTVVFDRKT
jgi:hypothetical protein